MKGSWKTSIVVMLVCFLTLSGCMKSPQEKRDAFMKSASSYVAEKKYAEAAIQYQNALQIAPDDVNALMGLGEAQIKLMRANEAYKSFAKAASVDPGNIKAHEYLATMQVLAKKFDMAEKSASAILKIDPKNVNARELLAQAYFQTDRKNEAVQIMEGLLREPKPMEATFMNTAQMYMNMGRADDALSLINRGAPLYPASAKLRFLGSDIHAFRGDIETARRWAEDGYRCDRKNMNAALSLARFYSNHKMDQLFNAHMAEVRARFPKDPGPYLLEAGIMRQKKDLDKALALAEKAQEIQDSTLNKTIIAQILVEKGEKDRAEKLLAEIVDKDPKAVPPRILLAEIYIRGNKPQKALDTLDALLKNMPQRPDIAAPAAQAYLMKGDLTKARGIVEKSLGEFKDNPQLHSLMAKIRFSEGNYENAVSEVEYLLKRSLVNLDLLYFGALSSLRLNQKEKAESFTGMMQKLAPESWQTLHTRSLIAVSKKDRQTAFQLAERAATLYPGKPQALTLYASLAPGVITNEEAVRRITGICSKNDTAFCHLIIARIMEASKDINGALGQMNTAIRMEPDNASLYHVLAQFYSRNNMIGKAIDEYQAIIHKKPDDMRAALMLALLNQGQGNISDAKKVYTYILEKDPKHALAANNLAWILSQGDKPGDLNEALRLAQLAKDKYPEDPRIADTLGVVLLKKGLNENAIAQFQLALEKMPQEPSINFHMATAMAALKRNAEARKYVETALNSKHPFDERAEAQKLQARVR